MKTIPWLLVLVIGCTTTMYAQVTGITVMEDSTLPGVDIYWDGSTEKVTSDFDGNFQLSIPKEGTHADLVFSQMDLKVVLQQIPLSNDSLALRTVELPMFKEVDVYKYEKLSSEEKKHCKPVYHFATLLGYIDMSQLNQTYIKLYCTNPITDFKYDPATLTVTVAWEVLKNCK